MKFIEEIREQLGVSGAEFGRMLGIDDENARQGYRSLVNAKDRIKLETLIALRRVSGLTDTELLDAIEKEAVRQRKRK